MMNLRDERFNYAENEYFSMAELPYGNEAFSMVVLLPAEGKSLDECLPQLNDERWGEWNSSLSSSALNLKLPRFEMEYDKELIDDMMVMGMQEALLHRPIFPEWRMRICLSVCCNSSLM